MKPLILKISGINSFMDEQVINFYHLTELGLFGIFGPTGSGKSTILDAITLSLYGEIPRAGKDLSGIINSHCDRGYVYYEFELGSRGEKKRYFVYRSYKKDKEGATRTQEVKLCDITNRESPVVLEEKVNRVNNEVVKIIGLKGNDFTRSVVLPQGNFGDFLQLSGKDKRDMLERIFALQEYGSQLSIKIRSYKNNLSQSYNFIEGKLKTYEGISQEYYNELEAKKEILEEEYNSLVKKFKIVEADYLFNKELYSLTKEYQEYKKMAEDLKDREIEIAGKKGEYDLAEKAKNIQPYIQQKNQLDYQYGRADKDLAGNIKGLEKTEEKLNEVTPLYNRVKERKEQDIPGLLVEKSKMEEAIEKLEKLERLEADYLGLVEREEKCKIGIIKTKDDIGKAKDGELTLIEEIKGEKLRLRDLQVSPIFRKNLYESHSLEREYKESQGQVRELNSNIENQLEILHPLKAEKIKADNNIEKLGIKRDRLKEELVRVEGEIKIIQEKNMAVILAEDLLEGESCPVCGSRHHPQKAVYEQHGEIEKWKVLGEKYSQELVKIESLLEGENKGLQEKINLIGIKEGLIKQWGKDLKSLKESLEDKEKSYLAQLTALNIEDIDKELKDIDKKDRELEVLQSNIEKLEDKKDKLQEEINELQEDLNKKENQLVGIVQNKTSIKGQIIEIKKEIIKITNENHPRVQIKNIEETIKFIEKEYGRLKVDYERYSERKLNLEKDQRGLEATLKQLGKSREDNSRILEEMILENQFDDIEGVEKAFKTLEEREGLKKEIKAYEENKLKINENLKRLGQRMSGKSISEEEWKEIQSQREDIDKNLENKNQELIESKALVRDIKKRLEELIKILEEKKTIDYQRGLLEELESLFKGNKFVEYISMGQLKYIAREASQELKKITRGRYGLELDIEGNFIIRDDFNGGVRRGTQTLSGGETFLTSLALALALSSQIQLKGKSPLEFFFLDEGFGTLDSDLLEIVMNSLEKLHSERLSVGLISHVGELKQRIPRKLIIKPAEPGIRGTMVVLERS